MRPVRSKHHGTHARGFSLTEVLLAVFILAIGIISIAALFPAGIAQQRLATDDAMGPVVAKHAMSIIRAKVKPEDFGTFEPFGMWAGIYAPTAFYTRTIQGDWGWMRPGFILAAEVGDVPNDELRGAIDIFSHYATRRADNNNLPDEPDLFDAILATEFPAGWPPAFVSPDEQPLFGIPYTLKRHQVWFPPRRIITQRERFYPMQASIAPVGDPDGAEEPRQPEYIWECMFRRYQGKVYVAIFVYRVSSVDARDAIWSAPANDPQLWGPGFDDSIRNFPPLPVRLDFVNPVFPAVDVNLDLYPEGPWYVRYSGPNPPHRPTPFVSGIASVDPAIGDIVPDDPRQSWQEHRQWLLDQNNSIHRVAGRRITPDGAVDIELTRPLQPVRLGPDKLDTTVQGGFYPDQYEGVFQSWPARSESPAEYFAETPYDPTTSAYANAGGPLNAPPPSFFNWNTSFDRGVVTRIWYMPRTVRDEFGNEWRITPVYVSVKEL